MNQCRYRNGDCCQWVGVPFKCLYDNESDCKVWRKYESLWRFQDAKNAIVNTITEEIEPAINMIMRFAVRLYNKISNGGLKK